MKERKDKELLIMRFLILWSFLVTCLPAIAFQEFQQVIPNGNRVPDPCDASNTWPAVGHNRKSGGGLRNSFGEDFNRFGKKWSRALCMLDSDRDGRSNGEELGDPTCNWRSESLNNTVQTMNITHPGLCDYANGSLCADQQTFLCTEQDIDNCPVLLEKDTRNITVRFPNLKVSTKVTTYTCVIFEFPQDKDYHMVATRPVIDNVKIMHHILLFGCDESETNVKEEINTPMKCGMIPSPQCSRVIGIWSKGMSGECMHESTGFRIGPNGFKKGALQIHWNNEQQISGMTDSSGLVIYYTPVLRPFDAGIMIVGQYWIDLPPQQDNIVVDGQCSSHCTTQLMSNDIKITRVFNHMHYLGREELIEQYRNGSKLRVLAHEKNYSYDQPVIHDFQIPVEFREGDYINVKCIYSTMDRSSRVLFGDSTSDEMCLGFITYFPKENLIDPYCTNWKSIPMCLLWNRESDINIQGCYIQRFVQGKDVPANAIIQNIVQSCDPYKTCSDRCEYSLKVAMRHPCFRGDVLDFIGFESRNNFPDFLIPFIICDHRKTMNFIFEVIFTNTSKPTVKASNGYICLHSYFTYFFNLVLYTFIFAIIS